MTDMGGSPLDDRHLPPATCDDAKYVLRDKQKIRRGSAILSRHLAYLRIALSCAAALAVAGCKNAAGVFEDQNEGGWFAKPVFSKPDWAMASNTGANLGPKGPVGAR